MLSKKLKDIINDAQGFTLIESLIVLSIFLLIMTLGLNLYSRSHQAFTTNLFLKQFTDDVLYAQQYAISNGTILFITIDSIGHIYRASTPAGTVLSRPIPAELEFLPGTMGLKFHFVPSGNINKAGVLYIHHDKRTIKINFLLGKGRFYMNEG